MIWLFLKLLKLLPRRRIFSILVYFCLGYSGTDAPLNLDVFAFPSI